MTTQGRARFTIIETKWSQDGKGEWQSQDVVVGETDDATEAIAMLERVRKRTQESGIRFSDPDARREANAIVNEREEAAHDARLSVAHHARTERERANAMRRSGIRKNPGGGSDIRARLQDDVEWAIDSWGLAAFLDFLSDLLMDKHYHIVSQWQDTATARPWKKAAEKLERMSASGDLPS